MIGQSLKELFPPKPAPVAPPAPMVLEAKGLAWDNHLALDELGVRSGEIVGLGGLEGQGQQTFLLAAFGLLKGLTGRLEVEGRPIRRLTPSVAKRPQIGLALVPEDRKTEGLIQEMSVIDNLRLASFSLLPFGLLKGGGGDGGLESRVRELARRMGLKARSLDDPIVSLSGGNQQKAALAKWLALRPKCLMLLDPTRGIDVKAKSQIYRLLRELADDGLAVILQSTDHEELVHLCDRVYVFYKGSVRAVLQGESLTAEALISASMNLDAPGPSEGGRLPRAGAIMETAAQGARA
jgi:ribose transport system ATP-binding protein